MYNIYIYIYIHMYIKCVYETPCGKLEGKTLNGNRKHHWDTSEAQLAVKWAQVHRQPPRDERTKQTSLHGLLKL